LFQELANQVTAIRQVAAEVFGETGTSLDYKVGTMIEIPRAALVADEVHSLLHIYLHLLISLSVCKLYIMYLFLMEKF
jgi:pyruvate,orthophosphate dikinase